MASPRTVRRGSSGAGTAQDPAGPQLSPNEEREARALLREALEHFAPQPSKLIAEDVARYSAALHTLLLKDGPHLRISRGDVLPRLLLVSDPLEEFDDVVMLRCCVWNSVACFDVVLSGGSHTPSERLKHVRCLFDVYREARFDVPMYSPVGGSITFRNDGYSPPADTVDAFVNCGPCSAQTLRAACGSGLRLGGLIVTVGANDDGTSLSGINQQQTSSHARALSYELDFDGRRVWDVVIEHAKRSRAATVRNLSVELSRFVLFPNPLRMQGTVYGSLGADSFFIETAVAATALFICSRPPPAAGPRVNEGNSIIDAQYLRNVPFLKHAMASADSEAYARGLELIYAYSRWVADTLATHAQPESERRRLAVSAAIPLMCASLLGGEYKGHRGASGYQRPPSTAFEGDNGIQFGYDPLCKSAKHAVACLTPESAARLTTAIRTHFDFFGPAYDPLAVLIAFDELGREPEAMENLACRSSR